MLENTPEKPNKGKTLFNVLAMSIVLIPAGLSTGALLGKNMQYRPSNLDLGLYSTMITAGVNSLWAAYHLLDKKSIAEDRTRDEWDLTCGAPGFFAALYLGMFISNRLRG